LKLKSRTPRRLKKIRSSDFEGDLGITYCYGVNFSGAIVTRDVAGATGLIIGTVAVNRHTPAGEQYFGV
jgi:hypothetical protein